MRRSLGRFVVAGVLGVELLTLAQSGGSKGIGPIKEVKLGAVDQQMVQSGKKLFDAKCAVCHALDAKKLGPPLRTVTTGRSPEWIMNLLLNVKGMLAQDPEAMEMRGQYSLPMPDQQLTQDNARHILEYLRDVAAEKK
jgi:cytochrome c